MKIKKATKKDIEFILKVRNQNISRKFSINKKKISYLEHYKWFKLNHSKKNFFLFIILIKKIKVGYVRVQKIKSKYFVSIAVLISWQNFGIAKMALRYVEIRMQKNLSVIFAKVNKYNKNSISLFRGLNYKKLNIKRDTILMKKEFKKYDYIKLIKKIENIRKKNNSNWMDILRLAFKLDPIAASKIMKKINHDDKEITKLLSKLAE